MWAPWILGRISFPKPSNPILGILSIRLRVHLFPIHFWVGLIYLFHLEPRALNLESYFFYDPKSFLFHLKPKALNPESIFHLWPRVISFLFRAQSSWPIVDFHLWLRVCIWHSPSSWLVIEPGAHSPGLFIVTLSYSLHHDPNSFIPSIALSYSS